MFTVQSAQTYVVEVVEDGEAVLRALAVRLGPPGACEGPGMAAPADPLRPPVLPGQRPLVPTEPPPGPEVGGAVSGDLLHEVVPLGRGVQRDHPHAAAGAVAAGRAPGEGAPSLPPGEEIVPALPHVVTGPAPTSATAGPSLLGQSRGRDLHDASVASTAASAGGGGRVGGGEGGEGSVRPGGCRVEGGGGRSGGSRSEGVETHGRVEEVLEELGLSGGQQRQADQGDGEESHLNREIF